LNNDCINVTADATTDFSKQIKSCSAQLYAWTSVEDLKRQFKIILACGSAVLFLLIVALSSVSRKLSRTVGQIRSQQIAFENPMVGDNDSDYEDPSDHDPDFRYTDHTEQKVQASRYTQLNVKTNNPNVINNGNTVGRTIEPLNGTMRSMKDRPLPKRPDSEMPRVDTAISHRPRNVSDTSKKSAKKCEEIPLKRLISEEYYVDMNRNSQILQ
jgi:hypothetical protein